MNQYNLTEITPELANQIVEYTKLKYDHGLTTIEGLKGGIFRTEYNDDYIYYNKESFDVFIATTKKNKSKSEDATENSN